MEVSQMLEVCMVVMFGISWPMSIIKSVKTKSTKGKSLFFLILIFIGYICGVLSKLLSNNITYVVIFYCINLVMVGIDLVLYYKNRLNEKKNENN